MENEEYATQVKEFDTALKDAQDEDEKWNIYANYIQFEMDMAKELQTQARVHLILEKAVAEFPNSEDIWLQYTSWSESQKLDTLNVYERACAACSDCTALWQLYLLALERAGVSYDELLSKWDSAKASISSENDCVAIYRSFIYITHRHLVKNDASDLSPVESLFAEATQKLTEEYDGISETSVNLFKNYAYYMYAKCKNTEKANSIWKEILSNGPGASSAADWLEYLKYERFYGSVANVRHHFYAAISRVSDSPYEVFEAFVQFEREEGTLDQLDKAIEAVNNKSHRIAKSAKKKNQKQQKNPKKDAKPKNKDQSGEKKNLKRNRSPKKDKNEDSNENNVDEHGFRRPSLPPSRKNGKMAKDSEDTATSSAKAENVDNKKMDVDASADGAASVSATFKYSTGMENNKLFVRNVHFACTSDELKEHFARYGEVESVRIVTHKDGKPKGVAYVDFINDEEAQKGLRADGSKIRDRKIRVYISNPPPKGEKSDQPQDAHASNTASSSHQPVQNSTSQTAAPPVRQPRAGQLFLPRSISKVKTAPTNGTSNGTNGN